MSWSYSAESDQPKDAVRLLVGDVDSSDPLVTDEEISQFVELYPGDVYSAAATVCEVIAAKLAREVSHSGDGLSFSGGELMKHYLELADRLRRLSKRLKSKKVTPYVGGISWAEREKADQDADKIQTAFRSHMHDNPGAGPGSEDELRPRW
jgi:hypothetical protein